MFNVLGKLLGRVLDRALPDRSKSAEAQSRINEAEVSGGPASALRLWRGFLGWVLAVLFAWEIVARPIIVTYWPGVPLPPSALSEITTLLTGMMGFGW